MQGSNIWGLQLLLWLFGLAGGSALPRLCVQTGWEGGTNVVEAEGRPKPHPKDICVNLRDLRFLRGWLGGLRVFVASCLRRGPGGTICVYLCDLWAVFGRVGGLLRSAADEGGDGAKLAVRSLDLARLLRKPLLDLIETAPRAVEAVERDVGELSGSQVLAR